MRRSPKRMMVVMIRAKGEAALLIPAVHRKLISIEIDRNIAIQSLRRTSRRNAGKRGFKPLR